MKEIKVHPFAKKSSTKKNYVKFFAESNWTNKWGENWAKNSGKMCKKFGKNRAKNQVIKIMEKNQILVSNS